MASHERILGYGGEGTGKTYAWLSAAEAYPNAPFFCIDTDDTTERMIETEFTELDNVEEFLVSNWEEFEDAANEVKKAVAKVAKGTASPPREETPWVVLDMVDALWEWVSDYYIQEVFKKDIGEYFLMKRKEMKPTAKKLEMLSGWTDWTVIKKVYHGAISPLLQSSHHHLFLAASVGAVRGDRGTKDLYHRFKAMPTGEKRTGHRVHTVLYFGAGRKGWVLSSVKDRGRELVQNLELHDFASQYLQQIGGWRDGES